MSEASGEGVKQVCCTNCHEWYDARAGSCYLCGEERPEYNAALANAVRTERLNAALGKQAGWANAEKRVSSQVPQGAWGQAPTDKLYGVPFARDIAASIKSKLQEGGAFG